MHVLSHKFPWVTMKDTADNQAQGMIVKVAES